MGGIGLKNTYQKVMRANGPAQMLTYAFWGVLMAGMFQGVCDMCFPAELLIAWGLISLSGPTTHRIYVLIPKCKYTLTLRHDVYIYSPSFHLSKVSIKNVLG